MSPMDTAAVAFAMPFASIDDRSLGISALCVSVLGWRRDLSLDVL